MNFRQKMSTVVRNIFQSKLRVVCLIIFLISAIFILGHKSVTIPVLEQNPGFVLVSEKVDVHSENGVLVCNIPDKVGSEDAIAFCDIGHLPYGVYNVCIEYNTSYGLDTEETTAPSIRYGISGTGWNTFVSTEYELVSYKSSIKSPFWVTALRGADKLQVFLKAGEGGVTIIRNMEIRENPFWRAGFLLFELIALILFCVFVEYMKKSSGKQRVKILLLLAIFIFASFPLLLPSGRIYSIDLQDHEYHINRLASVASELSYGNFPVVFQSDMKGGYGYIASLMYGSIFLYPAAILHLLGLSLTECFKLYCLGINFLTLCVAWYSFKGLFQKDRYAILGTAIYMLAAYRMTNAYLRAAIGEFTAMAFFPLIIYGLYRVYFRDSEGKKACFDTIPLILGISGVLESHVLSTEMIAPFILVFALVFWRKTFEKIVPLVFSVVMVLALNAWFWVPFLDAYRQSLDINSKEVSEYLQKAGLFLFQAMSFFMTTHDSSVVGSAMNDMPKTIGGTLVIGICLFVLVCAYYYEALKKQGLIFRAIVLCFLFGVLTLWMTTTHFPWDMLGGKHNAIVMLFTSIQFVWRYLALATVFFTVTTVYAIKVIFESASKDQIYQMLGLGTSGVLVFSSILVAGAFFTDFMDTHDMIRIQAMPVSQIADGLYVPVGWSGSPKFPVDPDGYATVGDLGTDEKNRRVFYVKEVKKDCIVSFPVIDYSFMRAYDRQSMKQFKKIAGKNKHVGVKLEKGYTGDIVITYKIPWFWKVAYVFSLLAIGVLVYLGIWRWKVERE